ncbi:twin-arginine translocase TatA/TatE family subunit [Rhodoluna sp.]|uniref:twin-arginine translocase TatA/TatE family subunit n=1 Tax=Rhodoluna sp. TaxID=1969481 RepID=UPI0025FA173B|nr:twin-arginine translocase TatA/TatE family subunit [Rhodoluna sp.]
MNLRGWEWIIILAIVLLLWGAPKLPGLAKSLGESIRVFRKEMKPGDSKSDKTADKGDNPSEK